MLASLITGIVSGEAAIAAKRAKTAAGAYAIAGILVLIGVVFLLIAAYVAIAQEIGRLNAALALGGGFLVVGLGLLALHVAGAKRQARLDAERRAREAAAIGSATVAALAPALIGNRHGLTVLGLLGAAATGYAIYRENRPRPLREPIDLPPYPLRQRRRY